ncbi:hypothetical protein [Nonomuraea sp. NPDC049625]|uniref:hypothetical protein n=1 Tax=Nonomuraea sp. NPDC049625 TaxID=3155775 RepID=UPI00343B5DE8
MRYGMHQGFAAARFGTEAFEQLSFEFGDASVGEPGVGAGGLKPFVQGPGFVGEAADLLLESGVLREEPAVGVIGKVGLVIAQAGQELTYLAALGDDLDVSGLDAVLGVQGSVFPGGLDLLGDAGGGTIGVPLRRSTGVSHGRWRVACRPGRGSCPRRSDRFASRKSGVRIS